MCRISPGSPALLCSRVPEHYAGRREKQGRDTMKPADIQNTPAARPEAPFVECISYSPQGAALATGRSRTRIFKAIKDRELIARKDGRATLLEADELRRWARSFPTIGGAAADPDPPNVISRRTKSTFNAAANERP
jgi:hypothetical protein